MASTGEGGGGGENGGGSGGGVRSRRTASTTTGGGGGFRGSLMAGFRGSVFDPSKSNTQPTRYQDHFSLQAPTSVVKFDKGTTARVIYMENTHTQLVIEERRDHTANKGSGGKKSKRRHITIKQMQEEAGGGLRFLRLTYTMISAFFVGFLFVFSVQVLLLIIFDLAVYTGYTNITLETSQSANYGLAVGVFMSLPILIHGLALMMMLAGFFVMDVWQGHYYFKKFVFPRLLNDIAIEWIFLLGLLILPLGIIAANLFARNEDWWEVSSLSWTLIVLIFYVVFILSVLLFEARVYMQIVHDQNILRGERGYDRTTLWGRFRTCIAIRKRNTLSGYTLTSYSSFGALSSTAMDLTMMTPSQDGEGQSAATNNDEEGGGGARGGGGGGNTNSNNKQHIIDGTYRPNQRGLYTRFTQLSFLQGLLYETLDLPKRIFSVDDVTGRRPYVTSVTWGLEKVFCVPSKKNRYISLVEGPFSITKAHLINAIGCSFLGVLLTYTMIAAVLVYQGFDVAATFVALIIILLLSMRCWIAPINQYREFKRLEVLQEEYHSNNNSKTNKTNSGDNHQEDKTKEQPASPVVVLSTDEDDDDKGNSNDNNNKEGEDVDNPTNKPDEEVEASLQVSFATAAASNEEKRMVQFDQSTATTTTGTDSSHALSWRGFDDSSGGEASAGVYNVREKYRVTQPTKVFRAVFFILEMFFCLVWPTFSLYAVEDWQLATVFFAIAVLSFLRHYTNAEVLLEEVGEEFAPVKTAPLPTGIPLPSNLPLPANLPLPSGIRGGTNNKKKDNDTDDANSNPTPNTDQKDSDHHDKEGWKNQSGLSQVAGTISRGRVYQCWRGTFWFFALAFLLLFIQSQSARLEPANDTSATFVRDFEYKPQNSYHYTNCEMSKNIEGNLQASMLDYNFFVMVAYRTYNATKRAIDGWYGPNVIQDGTDIVTAFRLTEENPSPVYYKLFIYEETNNTNRKHAIVAVRGSANAWDWFMNAQLWGSAALLQIVRSVLPFGEIFDPILDSMNDLLTKLQSGTLSRLAFYKSTTDFVNHLKASGNYSSIVITGHSLGGGLSLITGAQTQIQAYGISAPNAMISRGRFGITEEQLQTYTFNVIPDRDLVPKIDHPTKNIQRIKCNAPKNSLFGCHSLVRAFCETMHACGTVGRSFACECATNYGFPLPDPLPGTNRTFEEACGATRN